ncbi:uncharacterized protein [Dermacentor albipictus]|uniref:uncharacterized protein isoform X2 n=1 Tax=Dermacentor albipictus TaxID=60249 RepID=UPI0038FCB985
MASSAASLKVIDVTPVPWDNVYRFSHAMLANIKNMRMPPSCTEPRMPLYLCCLLWLTTPDLSRIVTQKIGNVSQRHHSQPLAVDVEHPSCCSHHENETFLDEGNWVLNKNMQDCEILAALTTSRSVPLSQEVRVSAITVKNAGGQVIPEVEKIRVLGLLIQRNRVNGETVNKRAGKAAAPMRLIQPD